VLRVRLALGVALLCRFPLQVVLGLWPVVRLVLRRALLRPPCRR
jgi:hypothetical protein